VTVDFEKKENQYASSCEGEYDLEYIWSSTDSCGNVASTNLKIMVSDTTPPEFCADDQTYAVMPCHKGDSSPELVAEPEVYDECDDEPSVEMTANYKVLEECSSSYTRVYEYTATDDCGNQNDFDISVQIDDQQAPELVDESKVCLFISYGESWGTWATYRIDGLFALTDDCDEAPELDEQLFKCNVTDDSSYVPVQKTTSVGNQFVEDCHVMAQGNDLLLVVKIDRQFPSSAAILGRTYHVYGTAVDECGNEQSIRRDVFIPRDRTIYEHVQPCSSGDPQYYEDPPTEI